MKRSDIHYLKVFSCMDPNFEHHPIMESANSYVYEILKWAMKTFPTMPYNPSPKCVTSSFAWQIWTHRSRHSIPILQIKHGSRATSRGSHWHILSVINRARATIAGTEGNGELLKSGSLRWNEHTSRKRPKSSWWAMNDAGDCKERVVEGGNSKIWMEHRTKKGCLTEKFPLGGGT